MRQKNLLI